MTSETRIRFATFRDFLADLGFRQARALGRPPCLSARHHQHVAGAARVQGKSICRSPPPCHVSLPTGRERHSGRRRLRPAGRVGTDQADRFLTRLNWHPGLKPTATFRRRYAAKPGTLIDANLRSSNPGMRSGGSLPILIPPGMARRGVAPDPTAAAPPIVGESLRDSHSGLGETGLRGATPSLRHEWVRLRCASNPLGLRSRLRSLTATAEKIYWEEEGN